MLNKFTKFVESYKDDMEKKLNDMNYDLKLEDISNLFLDLTDYNAIEFTGFSKTYYTQDTYKITYPKKEDGESDYDKPIKTPAKYMGYRIYIYLNILRESYRDEYIKIRNEILTDTRITDMFGHEYVLFNSKFIKYPSGHFSDSNADILEFWPKRGLWL